MATSNNAVILLKGQTYGDIKEGETLKFEKRPYVFNQLKDGEFVVKALYLSIDPYLRGRIRDESIKSYAPPYKVGEPMGSLGIGKVYKSNNSKYKEGTIVSAPLEWAEYTLFNESTAGNAQILENKYNLPLSAFTGVLGMPGFTAYSGLRHIGNPKKGETIFISAASGAVGQVVGQLAKRQGLKVVGSAGNDKKVQYLKEELAFDEAFNYKKDKPKDALPKLCPEGIDIYFENVGGETLEAVLDNANIFARIVACGMISQYGKSEPYGVKNLMNIVGKRIRFEGFIQGDLRDKYWNDFLRDVEKWVGEGEVTYKEDVTDGLENAIQGFIGMLEGRNFGKAVIKVSE